MMLSRDDKVIIKRFWRDWVVCYKQRLVLGLSAYGSCCGNRWCLSGLNPARV